MSLPDAIRAMLDRQESGRQALFRAYFDLRRQLGEDADEAQHREVAQAYNAYLRACLDEDPRALHDLQEEVGRLRAECARWRRGGRSA